MWTTLNRAALAAYKQLDLESIREVVTPILAELGLSFTLCWFDAEQRTLTVQPPRNPHHNDDVGYPASLAQVQLSVDRLPTLSDRLLGGETVYLDDAAKLVCEIARASDVASLGWAVEQTGEQSAILAPLDISDETIGVLMILGSLQERDVPSIRTFAGHIASAVSRAHLLSDAHRRIQELEALQTISFKLTSDLAMQPLMEAITDVALRLTDANNCHIYLVGETGFEFIAASSSEGSTRPAVDHPRPDGLVAQVAKTGEPLIINDAPSHPLYQRAEAQSWGIEAIAGYPLLRGGHVFGVFSLTYLRPHRFDRAERRILKLLVDQAAAAVEIAHLYLDLSRRSEDLSNLYRVAMAVSAQLSMEDVLEVTYEAVSQATRAETVAIGLYDQPNDELIFEKIRENGRDVTHPNLPVTDGQSLMAWVAHNRQELIINDLEKESTPVLGIHVGQPARSWMGFPLIAGDVLVGVMSVQSQQPQAFDQGHQRLCWGIAAQVAMALEKALLLGEVQQHNWELSVLNRVAAAASHSFDMETLLGEALSIVLDEMRMDAAVFHLLDDERYELTLIDHRNLSPDAIRELDRVAPQRGDYGRVVRTGKPLLVGDDPQAVTWADPSLSRYTSGAIIPLSSKDVLVGTLSLFCLHRRRFGARELDLLIAIGRQIGVAIDNALLYRKSVDRGRRLARLYAAARSLSSVLEAPALYQRVLETAMGELPVGGARLWLREDDAELAPHLSLGTLSGREDPYALATRSEMEWVLQGRESVLWGDSENLHEWIGKAAIGKRGFRAAVPLRGQASEIGVLEVVTPSDDDRLSGNDVEFLGTLAGIAAIARENAQLYEAVAQYAISLEAKINQRTAEVRREKEQTDAILRNVADGIFVLGDNREILLTNSAAEEMLNVSPPQALELTEFLRKVARQPDSDAPGPTITQNGQTLQARAAKLRHETAELGTVIVLRDVTHFEQVNRLKSEFVTTASHELRTPLSNIKLYLSLLERGRADRRRDYRRVLTHEVNRLQKLVQDLLDLSQLESRVEPVAKTVLNLAEVIPHVLAVLRPQAEAKHLTLRYNGAGTDRPHWVRANREHMTQMVMNLVANAINYTEPNGHITVELGAQTDRRGLWVTLAVEDTGVGIATGDLPRIFERFYRGGVQQHMAAGTGLGLSIVREILEQHDGWITVDSQLGVGTLFTLGLPALAAPEPGAATAQR